jgi:hypothetical protein
MERTPFQTPRPFPAMGSGGVASRAPANAAKASWQQELWATKAMMLNSGLTKEQTHILAAKAIGWQFVMLESLSTRELRIVREFFREELANV